MALLVTFLILMFVVGLRGATASASVRRAPVLTGALGIATLVFAGWWLVSIMPTLLTETRMTQLDEIVWVWLTVPLPMGVAAVLGLVLAADAVLPLPRAALAREAAGQPLGERMVGLKRYLGWIALALSMWCACWMVWLAGD